MAKKSKSEAPPFYLVRKGNVLVGEMNLDRERIAEFEEGKRLVCDVRQAGRNVDRLRFYWGFLRKVIAGTGCAPTEAALHQAIKIKTGYTDDVLLEGYIVKVAASIAFEHMEEAAFIKYLDAALEFISRAYGITPEQVFGEAA